jgi:hypothetical protein
VMDRQLNFLQAQIDIMKADQRPWVSVESIASRDRTYFSADRLFIPIIVNVKNTGRSPAIEVNSHVTALDTKATDKEPTDLEEEVCQETVDEKFGNAVFPGATLAIEDLAVINSAQMAVVRKTGSPLWPLVVGCITYKFPFEQAYHRTGFIMQLYVNNPGNSEDDEFPVDKASVPAKYLRFERDPEGNYAD